MLISQALGSDSILLRARFSDAVEAIGRLSELAAARLGEDASVVRKAVLDREATRSTALPNGSAVPHCRLAGRSRFAVALATLAEPLIWDQRGNEVDTIVLIASPEDRVADHMRILANSTQMLDSTAFREKLRSAPSAQHAYELVRAAESIIEERRSQLGVLREMQTASRSEQVDELVELVEAVCW